MQNNQSPFEALRDILSLILSLDPGESVAISVQRHQGAGGKDFMVDWQSSNGTPCGASETANALRKAYENH